MEIIFTNRQKDIINNCIKNNKILPKTIRIIIYKYTINKICYFNKIFMCCIIQSILFRINTNNHIYINDNVIHKLLPEFNRKNCAKLKLEDYNNNKKTNYWFFNNNKKSRIIYLKWCIKQVKQSVYSTGNKNKSN